MKFGKIDEQEQEIERLRAVNAELQCALSEIVKSDIGKLRGIVNVLADKLARYTGKTVPGEIKGAESVLAINEQLLAACEVVIANSSNDHSGFDVSGYLREAIARAKCGKGEGVNGRL